VDTRQLARVPGRKKTDPVDCQWIQRLHSCGLLLGSFRRKYEGLSCVFSSASQSAACEVEQIRLSRPTPNIKRLWPLPTRVCALVGRLKPCASRLETKQMLYENAGVSPLLLHRKVARGELQEPRQCSIAFPEPC
jgi:hypothetical protein